MIGNPLNYEIVESSRFDYVGHGFPLYYTNPPYPHMNYLDVDTGEIFHCIDHKKDWNIWKGNFGNLVVRPDFWFIDDYSDAPLGVSTEYWKPQAGYYVGTPSPNLVIENDGAEKRIKPAVNDTRFVVSGEYMSLYRSYAFDHWSDGSVDSNSFVHNVRGLYNVSFNKTTIFIFSSSWATLASAGGIPTYTRHSIKVVDSGLSIKVYIDDVLKLTYNTTDNSGSPTHNSSYYMNVATFGWNFEMYNTADWPY